MEALGTHPDLARELRTRLLDLRHAAKQVDLGLKDATTDPPHRHLQNSLARDIHNFYGAIEDAAYRVSNAINGELPAGPDSHSQLIERVLADVPGKRRPLYSGELATDLKELRHFRHFFRHAYAAEMEWTKLKPHAERVLRILPAVARDLEAFAAWAESGEPP